MRPGLVHKAALSGEDRPDHRTGEGVHRTAGDRWRTVRAGAAARSDACRSDTAADRATQSTTITSRSRWKMMCPARRRRGALDRRQGGHDRRNVRARAGTHRLEGSVCACAGRPTDREDRLPSTSCRCGSAASDAGRARRVTRSRQRRRSSSPTEQYQQASSRHFFRERLEFYLRDVRGFAYDVVNAVLAAER